MATPPTSVESARLTGLLAKIALGDQAAFGEFYDVTSPHLYGVALRILRRPAIAEEILQEAYVNVWHHAGSYDVAKSQPLTWLTSIVRNRCLDLLRRREIETVTLTSDDDDAPKYDLPSDAMTPAEMLLAGFEAKSVRDCVDTLDAGPKQAIALAFYHGLSHFELAHHLREPLGTVKSWVRRGLERLKSCLDRAGLRANRMNLSRPDRLHRLDALAAAYVLGTLPARARMRLARVAQTDTMVASTIRAWELRLSPLAEAAPSITPPPGVWRVIALRLGLEPVRPRTPGPWWTRLAFWRGLAAASLVATLALGVTLIARMPEPPMQPIVVVLAGPDAKPALLATIPRGERSMMVKTVGGDPVPPGKSLELWMLPNGAAPRSLGLLPAGGVGRVMLPATSDVAFANVPALAVSLEQAGGSPTGAPQGPVLYTGKVEKFY